MFPYATDFSIVNSLCSAFVRTAGWRHCQSRFNGIAGIFDATAIYDC